MRDHILEDIIQRVEKLNITDGDTIVISSDLHKCHDTHIYMREVLRPLGEHLRQSHGNVIILFLYEGQKVETFNEEEMNKMGWFRDNN